MERAETHPTSLSVVIPTLNAGTTLTGCLASLSAGREAFDPMEIIVVDAGSTDATRRIAQSAGATVLRAQPGRGQQLGAGAEASSGSWLLFLHADTRLDPDWAAAARAFIEDPENKARAGVFKLAFDSEAAGARRVAALANWRTRALGLPYGDQGLLIARELYQAVGGYPPLSLMEDVAVARTLGRRRLRLLPARAVTSAARYEDGGWWAVPLRNLALLALYLLGASPEWLQRHYR